MSKKYLGECETAEVANKGSFEKRKQALSKTKNESWLLVTVVVATMRVEQLRKDEEKITFPSGEPQGFCVKTPFYQALTRHSDPFLQASWTCVVRLPQPLSAGVAAQTLLTYVFFAVLGCSSNMLHLQCTVRSLGESHH